MSTPKTVHVGMKYLQLVIVAVLAIAALFFQFWTWMTGTPNFTNLGMMWLMLLAYELVFFLIHLTWKFFSKYLKQIIPDYAPLGFKTIIVWVVMAIGLLWTVYNFFIAIQLVTIPVAQVQSFGIGLVILWIGAVVLFFFQVLWAVAHRLSDM